MAGDQGAMLQAVKKINRSKVLQFIYEKQETSRPEIAQSLGLSLPTIANCLKELEISGLIIKGGYLDSTGGRKARKIIFHSTVKIAIGVEILKDYARLAAVDLYGNVLEHTIISIVFDNTREYQKNLCTTVNSFIRNLPYPRSAILGIGIAIQGLVSSDLTTLIYGKILNANDLNISYFQNLLGLPCVLVHDAEAAANAELLFLPQVQDAVYLSLNKNLGSAIIMNRSVLTGINRIGGTLEHVCMVPGGKLCYCGNRGCADTYCSAGTILEESGMPLDQFFSFLRRGDYTCNIIWNRYLNNLSSLMASTRHIFDTDFIIGGLLSKYFRDNDFDYLREQILARCPFNAPVMVLHRGKNDDHATVTGAALYYINDYFKLVL